MTEKIDVAALRKAHRAWSKAVEIHHAALGTGPVTSEQVRRSGQRCASTYSRLTDAAVNALPALLEAAEAKAGLEGEVSRLREALRHVGRKLMTIEDAVPTAKDANVIILAALSERPQ